MSPASWRTARLLQTEEATAAAAAPRIRWGGGPAGAFSITARRALQDGNSQGDDDVLSNGQQQQQQQLSAAWSGMSYMQLQCAEGYTGTLCAACCQPGHYLQPGFECSQCPGVGRTLLLGLLVFAGSVGLVLVVAAFNLSQKEEEGSGSEMPEAADVVKIALLYVQYAVVVFCLNIDYPNAITAVVSAASSLTWADALLGFSPACLAPGLGSGAQAKAQLLGSLLIPCAVVAASLGLWALRYAVMWWRPFGKDTHPGVHLMASSSYVSNDSLPIDTHVLAKAPSLFRRSGTDEDTTAGGALPTVFAQPSTSVLVLHPTTLYVLDLQPTTPADAPAPVQTEQATASNPASQSVVNAATPDKTHASSQALDCEQPSRPGSAASTSLATPPLVAKRRLWARQAPSTKASNSLLGNQSSLVRTASRARSYVASRISRGTFALAAVDRALPLTHQLGVVLLIGVFVMYPSWVQAALGVFACYVVDSGEASLYPENQRASWRRGYWVRDMTQQCYAGGHLRVAVPIGVASIVVFCFTPPLASFLLLWSVRNRDRRRVLQQHYDKRRPLRALLQLLRSCCGLEPSANQARP